MAFVKKVEVGIHEMVEKRWSHLLGGLEEATCLLLGETRSRSFHP